MKTYHTWDPIFPLPLQGELPRIEIFDYGLSNGFTRHRLVRQNMLPVTVSRTVRFTLPTPQPPEEIGVAPEAALEQLYDVASNHPIKLRLELGIDSRHVTLALPEEPWIGSDAVGLVTLTHTIQYLPRSTRLELATSLAKTIVEWLNTGALSNKFDADDIMFPASSESVSISDAFVRIHNTEASSKLPDIESSTPRIVGLLRELGILLTELAFGRTLFDLWKQNNSRAVSNWNDHTNARQAMKYTFALELLASLERECGELYVSAVRQCFYPDWYTGQWEDPINIQLFIQEGVYQPLLENLFYFNPGRRKVASKVPLPKASGERTASSENEATVSTKAAPHEAITSTLPINIKNLEDLEPFYEYAKKVQVHSGESAWLENSFYDEGILDVRLVEG